ncbi:helix-turn-helix transcriptional regulator [Iamia majanohamensis]|uniref:Helix-turn-helix transcriptional regulator n=1 Tax=Iamia majanohamensis TaxID=467976 RepID=A0AAE9YBE1_9ACTN|nr:helix-turn-helix transcriptional regulator [Iamia majanohamensis]WCO67919.1 helix-turn-helix transcriptional regulator [Iamia majanohamensis]
MTTTAPLHTETRTVPVWTLGDRLGKALDHAGIKVGDMAAYLDVGRNTVGNYIAGRTQPSRATVLAWAMRTGIDPTWLETGELPTLSPDGTPAQGGSPTA